MSNVSNRPSFQGDVMIRRIKKIPAQAKPTIPEGGYHIVAHSETGHHHVIDSRSAQMLIEETNKFIAWLDVAEETTLRHLRNFDTHAPLTLPPGKYEIRRQREHAPEGWRPAAD